MRYQELNKTFNNERGAFEYRDNIWFEYGIMGTIYTSKGNTQTVVFEEEIRDE